MLMALLVICSCGRASTAAPQLRVVATISPLADWARQVGRERVVVTQLVPTGVDPQNYTLSEADKRALAQADIVLLNGLGLEPWLMGALADAPRPELRMLELGQYVGPASVRRQVAVRVPIEGSSKEQDDVTRNQDRVVYTPSVPSPYLWLSPGPDMAQKSVLLISDIFTLAQPDHVLFYRRNAEQYNGQLENLDNWIRRQIELWPRIRVGDKSVLAMQASDRSWHYFAQRYGINLRTTASLKAINPPLPPTTPLFIDPFLGDAERLRLVGLRQPDGVLHPLSDDQYIDLIKTNVQTMTLGVQRAARAVPKEPSGVLNTP